MKDKFILMNLDDKRSKKISEVLGNQTCKKILDYLGDNSEASEKDIADALNMKINTIEYNLKKLLSAGLIEKTKNFFWSKKGRKIPMYKLAKKHIVISPKSSKPNLTALQSFLPIIAVLAFVFILAGLLIPSSQQTQYNQFNKFNSLDELQDFLKENTIKPSRTWGGILEGPVMMESSKLTDSTAGAGTSDYSETNIQVQGVDEADIVKNDGKYIYTISNNKVVILNAYPAEDMEILSEIKTPEANIAGILINNDKLIIITNEYSNIVYENEVRCMAIECVMPRQETQTKVYIYDLSDRTEPELKDTISISGNYHNSRMIRDYVYVINNQYISNYNEEGSILPAISTNKKTIVIEPEEIYYSDIKDVSFQYTIISAINIKTGETSSETLLTGRAQNIYVSQDNIYTTYTKSPQWHTPAEFAEEGSLKEKEKTIINKFSIDRDEIEYTSTGEVPGHILNQFSMDQHKDNFRIATTIGETWNSDEQSQNNVYILNEDLETTGKIEGLAPGEKIYSVRFMGEKAYVVTFKKVDPLFVLDLSDSENPKVLGKLKIPGYSDYLHPYDENHIIGIGKDTTETKENFALYQGVKIAMFDVTDVENPIELHKIIIGDRGTGSEVLRDHKAFLFDKEKELMVLPIDLYEVQGEKTKDNQYGQQTFQGAYVYNINLEDGFDLKGRITHVTKQEELKRGYGYDWNTKIRRSLYMDDVLYTISDNRIKVNELDELEEVGVVEFV